MKKWILTGVIILSCSFGIVAEAKDWPSIEFPKNAEVNIVSDGMLYNGYPMRTWILKDTQSPKALAEFFERQWRADSDKFDAREFNGDYVINSLQSPYILTARISEEFDGATALIGITKNLNQLGRKRINNDFPMPSGSKILSNIQSRDLYKKGHTLIVKSGQSLSASYHFYREYYLQRGWVEVTGILDSQEGKAALQLSQGLNVMDISFQKQNSAVLVVANQVKEG